MQTQANTDGLYLALVSIHGLIRGDNLELGHDADTGGQTKYVIELARALAAHPEVARVDLLTRQVIDPTVDPSYAQPEEEIAPGAYVIRIPCGPRRYLRKELLWPHLQVFTDRAAKHFHNVGRRPDIIHSHYADAGWIGAHLANLLAIPLVHTGHSLGRDKLQRLLEQGMSQQEIEEQYNINQRIEAEEYTLDVADKVIASTRQEIEEQYQLYDNYHPEQMVVIPPGVELDLFHAPKRGWRAPGLEQLLGRFLLQPAKPMILALARADRRKNVANLLHAFGQHPTLREEANLVVFVGNRENFDAWEEEPKEVFRELLMLIDQYDLYGHIAYPTSIDMDNVPEIYRLAARRKGVFVNPALTEPFGLTLIEAAASGLPLVATENGGPTEIIANCDNGLLVDPLNVQAIGHALHEALADAKRWQRWSKNGIRGAHEFYSWSGHAQQYVREVKKLIKPVSVPKKPAKGRLSRIDRLIIADIDNTLIGDGRSLKQLLARLKEYDGQVAFGVATGRRRDSALKALAAWEVPVPDVIISSVGTEIYYERKDAKDSTWCQHIDYRWRPEAIRKAMADYPGIEPQPDIDQRPHKISYFIDPDLAPSIREIQRDLRRHDLHVNVVYSHQAYLDILPMRASKGTAVRFIAEKWDLPTDHVLVAGDSGNDTDMLAGDTLGVVVGNHSPELKRLRGRPDIYFAKGKYAQGIIEGLSHYAFFAGIAPREEEAESGQT